MDKSSLRTDSELFPSFCPPPSEVVVLFNSNLSRRPFLRKVVDLDLLHAQDSIRNMRFVPMSYFDSETNE